MIETTKKGIFSIALAMGLFLIGHHPMAYGRSLVDQNGDTIEISDQPRRVITTAPSLAEVAADILGSDLERIVGVSEFTSFPPSLSKRSSVGPFFKLNLEKILSLKPDLVLATKDGNSREDIRHLRELGIPVIILSTQSLLEVANSMEVVGRALGFEDRGLRMASQFRKGIENFKQRATGRKSAPRVLLQVGMDPLVVAGGKTFLSEALALTGAQNVYQKATQPYPRPSLEDAVSNNPDSILIIAMDSASLSQQEKEGRRWQEFPLLSAVKEKRIFVVPGDRILRPSLGLLEGIALIERTLFP